MDIFLVTMAIPIFSLVNEIKYYLYCALLLKMYWPVRVSIQCDSCQLLLLLQLRRSPYTSVAVTVVQPPFQKFLDPPLSSFCKRNTSSLRSSTLRSSHSNCERSEIFLYSSLAFAARLEVQVLCEGQLLPSFSLVSTDVFCNGSRVEACSESTTQIRLIDKQKGVYFEILMHSSSQKST